MFYPYSHVSILCPDAHVSYQCHYAHILYLCPKTDVSYLILCHQDKNCRFDSRTLKKMLTPVGAATGSDSPLTSPVS